MEVGNITKAAMYFQKFSSLKLFKRTITFFGTVLFNLFNESNINRWILGVTQKIELRVTFKFQLPNILPDFHFQGVMNLHWWTYMMLLMVLKIKWCFHFRQKKINTKEAHYAICYSSRLQFHRLEFSPKFVIANFHFRMSQKNAIFGLEIFSLTLEYEWKLRYSKTFLKLFALFGFSEDISLIEKFLFLLSQS